MKCRQKVVLVVIVAAKDNELVFRDVCGSRNQSFHIVGVAAVGDMGAGRFGQTIHRGHRGKPLFGEKINTVVRDDERLTVEIGGLLVSGEIGLVFVGEPNGIHLVIFVLKRNFADSEYLEILPVPAVIAHISNIQIVTIL